MKTRTLLYIRIGAILGVLCLALALFAACGGQPSYANSTSTEGLVFSDNGDGSLTVTGYEGTEPAVTIDTFGGKPIRTIAHGAFSENETVTSVSLGQSVEQIESAAFANCPNLAALNTMSSSLICIGDAAFLGCDLLTTVSLPATVESIGVDAFLGCNALSKLSFGGNGVEWTRIKVGANNDILDGIVILADGKAFEGFYLSGDCTSTIEWLLDTEGNLTVVGEGAIPDYGIAAAPWYEFADSIKTVTVSGEIDIVGKNAFGGCTTLVSATLAESVRLVDDSAFYGCINLEQVTLPNNLRRIGAGAFYGCERLASVSIPDSVTHVGGGAFMNCTRLGEIHLGGGITAIAQWTFSGCETLVAIDLPASVTEIGVGAFYGCIRLAEITLGGSDFAVEKNAFANCPALSTVTVRGGEWTIANGNNDFITAVK